MENQSLLEELLKKKGIGPQGSKSLSEENISSMISLLTDTNVSLTTRATMITALLILDPNETEEAFIATIKSNLNILQKELSELFSQPEGNTFRDLVLKIIGKQDLNESEAALAMDYFFDPSQPDYLKASFLEGERLKRETFTENKVFFQKLWQKAARKATDLPALVHICDSYDGFNRTRNFTLFTAATLAATGYPVIVTGIDSVAPKFGYTHHQLLKLGGKNPLISHQTALDELQEIKWTYLDQQVFLPELYALQKMRKEMVKRPFLATFEKLLQPIRSEKENFIVTGYTHPHYKEELIKQIKEQGMTAQALVLKGMEGSTHLSMSKDTVKVHFDGNEISASCLNPVYFNLDQIEEKQDKTITPDLCLEEGLSALKGEKNNARENIIYLAAAILDTFKLEDTKTAVEKISEAIDSGKALKAWSLKK
jgi:anthranilate phosphoribosyltransferase